MLKPLKLCDVRHVLWIWIDSCHSTISCSKQNQLTVVRCRQSCCVRRTGKVCVLQILVHFRREVEDLLRLKIVLPDNEVALLTHSQEVNAQIRSSWIDYDLVDAFRAEYSCATFTNEA